MSLTKKYISKLYYLSPLMWLVFPILFFLLIFTPIININQIEAEQSKSTNTSNFIEVPRNGLKNYQIIDTQGQGAGTIFFNNAWKSQFDLGYAYLKGKGVQGTVSVITRYVDYPAYINWKQLKEIQDNGWEITSQSRDFICDTNVLNTDQLRDEVYGSKSDLFAHGLYSEHFASPCGITDLRLSERVSYYYSSQKIGEEGLNPLPITNSYTLKGLTLTNKTSDTQLQGWINEAKTSNSWVIFTINQIDDSNSDSTITPEKFKKFADQIISSQLNLITPSQIISGKGD